MKHFFDSPGQEKKLNKSNTFFDDQFAKDLFASFSDMKTPATSTANNGAGEQDLFNDPMLCSTPTPTSSGSSSTFFSAMIANDDNSSNHSIDVNSNNNNNTSSSFSTHMRESMGKKQIIEAKAEQIQNNVDKPKGKIEKKKKQKKFKPTNILLKAEVAETKAEEPMKPPANDEGTYSQVDYEITASGAFWIDDVKITEEGITRMPSTICTQTQSQSPFKAMQHHESISSPTKTSRFMNQTNGANLLHFEKKKYGQKKVANVPYSHLETVKKLGEGASSTVELVKDAASGKLYAKKIVKLAKDIQPKLILSEITTLYNCVECSNILRFYNAYFADNKIHILLEYMDGNSLESLAGIKVPEKILEMITFQVLKGLYFLHFRKKIVHRDLKPANILIKLNGEVKISDMGLTGIFKKNNQVSEGGKYGPRNQHVWNTCQGTIMYMSPERINEKPHTYNSDIWSLGVTLLELAFGEFPFKSGTYFDVMDEINNIESKNPLAGMGFSEVFEDFIKNCLKVSPEERYSCRDLLSHQFVFKYLNTPDQEICEQISKYMASIAKQKDQQH